MRKATLQSINKSMSVLTTLALVLSTFGFAFGTLAPSAFAVPVDPAAPTTNAVSGVTSSDATLNGTNGNADAIGSSFWVSTSTFPTTSSTLPSGVFSTADLGAIASSTAYSAALSSITGILPVTPSTTYYYAAWTNVGGIWSPGAVLQFTTNSLPGTLSAQDFGVMNFSGVKGYTAGFGLADADFTGAQSIVMQLYSGATLLQTNTATNPAEFPGLTQISSPFDVFGTFDYVSDGYWTNVRGAEYGQTLIPTKVVATVTLANGKVVTAENDNLTGDPATIFPAAAAVTTNAATGVSSSNATLNGMNGTSDASGHSFWVSTSTFSTANPTIPAGVFSTADLGAVASSTAFSALLSAANGLPSVTPSTTYYFAAWSFVDGTWYPGEVLHFTTSETPTPSTPVVTAVSPNTGSISGGDTVTITGTGFTGATAAHFGAVAATGVTVVNDTSLTVISPATTTTGVVDVTVTTPLGTSATSEADQFTYALTGTVTGGPGVLTVTSITPVQTTAISDNTFANGWSYLFNITVPTNEPDLSMKFADWLSGANILPVANNMQISSAQASSTAPVVLTAANVYSSPALHMIGDLSTSTPGYQVQVLVQVKIPSDTANGSYTTSYGVQTQP